MYAGQELAAVALLGAVFVGFLVILSGWGE